MKMFAAEVEESARFARAVKRLYRCTHDYASAYAAFAASTYTFLPYCTSCLVLYYGGKLHTAGQLAGGKSPSPPSLASAPACDEA